MTSSIQVSEEVIEAGRLASLQTDAAISLPDYLAAVYLAMRAKDIGAGQYALTNQTVEAGAPNLHTSLIAALEPFAALRADDGDTFDSYPNETILRCEVSVGEIKQARAALAMRGKEQNQPVTVAAHPTLPVVVADGELEPCPWCGHAESLEIVDMGQTFGTVHCNGCGCDGPVDDGRPSRAWNTRAKEPLAQGDEVERAVLAHLKTALSDAKELGSGSDFNQGVVRGLEIAVAQIENGHHRAALVRSKLPIDRDEANWDRIERVLWGVRDGSITPESAKQHILTAMGSQSIEGERAPIRYAKPDGRIG